MERKDECLRGNKREEANDEHFEQQTVVKNNRGSLCLQRNKERKMSSD